MLEYVPEIFLAVIVFSMAVGYWLNRKELYAAAVRRLEERGKLPPAPPSKPKPPKPNASTH